MPAFGRDGDGARVAEVPFLTLFEPPCPQIGKMLRAINVKGGSSREAFGNGPRTLSLMNRNDPFGEFREDG